jgi:hypothetical protein
MSESVVLWDSMGYPGKPDYQWNSTKRELQLALQQEGFIHVARDRIV